MSASGAAYPPRLFFCQALLCSSVCIMLAFASVVFKVCLQEMVIFFGRVNGAFVIDDQLAVEVVYFMLDNAGREVEIALVELFARFVVKGADLYFRKTTDFDIDSRTGKATFFKHDQLSPCLRD